MQSFLQFVSLKKNIDSLLAAAFGFFIIYLITQQGGIGISPDSVVYTSVARNLAAYGKLIDYNTDPLTDFPFFYPAFLACIIWVTHLDPTVFGAAINALLFALLIYVCGCAIGRFSSSSKIGKCILLCLLLLSPALLQVYVMLWSETLFIVQIVMLLIVLKYYFLKHSVKALLLAASIIAFACVTRYAGIVLISFGGLLLLADTTLRWKKKILHLLLFGIISSSLLIVNIIHNKLATQTATGNREKGMVSFNQNMSYYGGVLCNWLHISNSNYVLTVIVAYLFIIGFLLIICWRRFRSANFFTLQNIAAVFFVVYSLFIVVISTLLHFEQINNRFVAPAFVPLLLSIPNPFHKKNDTHTNRRYEIGLYTIGLLVLIGEWATDINWYKDVKQNGISGYTSKIWTQSSVVHYIQQHSTEFKQNYTIYSNAHEVVYFFLNRSADALPQIINRQEIADFLEEDHVYIIWFDTIKDKALLNLPFVLTHKKMVLLHQFNDGAIYQSVDEE